MEYGVCLGGLVWSGGIVPAESLPTFAFIAAEVSQDAHRVGDTRPAWGHISAVAL